MSDHLLDPIDPHETNKDYAINWATLLTGESDTASSATWDASVPAGLTVNSATLSGTTTTIWVGTPELGRTYGLTCHLVTVGGRTHDRTISIPCQPL